MLSHMIYNQAGEALSHLLCSPNTPPSNYYLQGASLELIQNSSNICCIVIISIYKNICRYFDSSEGNFRDSPQTKLIISIAKQVLFSLTQIFSSMNMNDVLIPY